jgi:hypothetical protein
VWITFILKKYFHFGKNIAPRKIFKRAIAAKLFQRMIFKILINFFLHAPRGETIALTSRRHARPFGENGGAFSVGTAGKSML